MCACERAQKFNFNFQAREKNRDDSRMLYRGKSFKQIKLFASTRLRFAEFHPGLVKKGEGHFLSFKLF